VAAQKNWHRIEGAAKGIGPLLLRAGGGPLDPAFVGYESDDGRWFCADAEVHPTHYSEIPPFDADDGAAS
jgi:hypothetical protein